ncbi:class I SAM-dependent methyltransferase [Streptomyces sp. A475]|uniref:class I SAM-dependent methyltransferase n=1 Tax=Streptomyces sp. A475 TaxID=3131976 RepID=UPI0030C8FF21
MRILHERQTPEYWDHAAQRGEPTRQVTSFEASMFRAYVDPPAEGLALDAGCGTGEFAARMATWGLDVIGLDFSPYAVEAARRQLHAVDGLRFFVHDFNADVIPRALLPRTVDVVVCRLSIAFFDRERFLGDVRRWLAPDGVLHITTAVSPPRPPGQSSHRGLTEQNMQQIAGGFRTCTRYDLENDGSVTCLVLRGPR